MNSSAADLHGKRVLIDAWKSVYPHAEVHRIETASHFLQEDEPEQIVSLIQDLLRRNP